MKVNFTLEQIDKIIHLYLFENWSTSDIAKLFFVSKTPIIRILKKNHILRKGTSDGKKIILSDEVKDKIKYYYLIENKNVSQIGLLLNLTASYVDKYLNNCSFRRNKSEATKLSVTGRKVSKKGINNMILGQKNLVLSGRRKQTGGICKIFDISGLKCQGTYEKSYIEHLINENIELPKNGELIITPYGGYYPDFQYDSKLVEVKSSYTYDVLLGLKINRWTNKFDMNQLEKIKWVNKNIMPVEIVIIEKNKIKEIKLM